MQSPQAAQPRASECSALCKQIQDSWVISRQLHTELVHVRTPGWALLPRLEEPQGGTHPHETSSRFSSLFCRQKLFIPSLAKHAVEQLQL